MILTDYIAFVLIASAYIASPGPAVFIAINYSLVYGLLKTIFLLTGNTMGLGILAFLSAVGIGAIIVSSPAISLILKIAGSIVLIYMGIKMIISAKGTMIEEPTKNKKRAYSTFIKEGLILSLTNPKPIIFFLSIYPQFIRVENGEVVYQFALLGISFMGLSFFILTTYALLSKYILGNFLNKEISIIFNHISGYILVIMAVALMLS